MLKNLFVSNVAVIERLTLDLTDGFTVMTGETGAGKSIIIDSINMVLGGRTSRELVRSGEQVAHVSALFETEEELLVERSVTADGKSNTKINGRPATAAMLREMGEGLVSIHGQHDNQRLLQPSLHIDFIDQFAGIQKLVESYSKKYEKMLELRRRIDSHSQGEREKSRKMDMLRFQIDEITAADLKIGEMEELTERRAVMRSAEKLVKLLSAVYEMLDGEEGGALSLLGQAKRQLESGANISERLSGLSERLGENYYGLSDISSEVMDFLEELDFDGSEIDQVEQRYDTIEKLCRKYGDSVEDVILFCNDAQKELDNLEFSEKNAETLEKEYNNVYNDLVNNSLELSKLRKKAAQKAEKLIEKELKFLNMPKAKFEVSVSPKEEIGSNGADEVEFLLSANAGLAPRPLAKIASGGELSRVMLAIRSIIKDDAEGTLIFDEIDTGVSGSAAEQIGLKLRELASSKQVLCVTHLAQIACLAKNHYVISKDESGGATATTVTQVEGEERALEIARLISGNTITEAAIDAAKEMLVQYKNF